MDSPFSNYPFKTVPEPHQLQTLIESYDREFYAIHHEQGCGKSKIIIDNISQLFLENKINGALIVAPNGVDLNWFKDELPAHLPALVAQQSRFFRFNTKKSNQKWHKDQVKFLREFPTTQLAWMFMSYDAFMTLNGKEAALLFIEQRSAFYVLDESTRIKTPGAKRTQRIVRTAWRSKYRRTLTGTPMPNGAFDIYEQMKFLNPGIWASHGWDSFSMFKSHFGVFEKGYNNKTQTEFEKLLGFRHLEELNRIIAPHSSRVLKRDVLSLPPKIYQRRYFELTPQQRTLYNQLRNEFHIWLDQQTLVTANMAMVRMLRLQQISCGYLPMPPTESPDAPPVHIISGDNPRLLLLQATLQDNPGKTIIWANYHLDLDLIAGMLQKNDKKYKVLDGRSKDMELQQAKEDFQKGDLEYLVATQQKLGEGHTLHAAEYVIYYNNRYNLKDRLQSEDRAHRKGLTHSVVYIDLLGNDTMDRNALENLCGKLDVSDAVLGDVPGVDIRTQLRNWLLEEQG